MLRPGFKLSLLLLTLAVSSLSFAESYPVKPLRFVIPLAPGGGTDMVARRVAQRLSEALGQSVIPDNRPAVDGLMDTRCCFHRAVTP